MNKHSKPAFRARYWSVVVKILLTTMFFFIVIGQPYASEANITDFESLLNQGNLSAAKDELRALYKNQDIDNDELLKLLDIVDAKARTMEQEDRVIHERQLREESDGKKVLKLSPHEEPAATVEAEREEPKAKVTDMTVLSREHNEHSDGMAAGNEALSFKGIALGDEAERLLLKYKIALDDVNGWSSDESCNRIAAKRLISCVYRIASCMRNNSRPEYCPAKDSCASEYERSVRAQEDSQCREEAAEANKLDKWSAKRTYAIRPRQIVCSESNQYREVANAYRDGNLGPLRRESGYGCRVIEEITLVKILGKSKDGKLYHVEYPVPYSTQITSGWLSTGGLISKKEYMESRF